AADAAHAKAFRDGQLARVDHVTALGQAAVERGELECRIGRHAERDDDRRLPVFGQKRHETQFAHARDEHLEIVPVTTTAAGDTTLGLELVESLVEREYAM